MTMTASELTYVQNHTQSTVRSQRPRLSADQAQYYSQAGGSAPANTTAPVASGTGTVGYTLTCTRGVWTNSPVAYGHQWKRDAAVIVDATRTTYLLTTADSGHSLSCSVTAFTGGGQASANSNAISVT